MTPQASPALDVFRAQRQKRVADLETQRAERLKFRRFPNRLFPSQLQDLIDELLAALPEITRGDADMINSMKIDLLRVWLDFDGASVEEARKMREDLEDEWLPGRHDAPHDDYDSRRLRVLLLPIVRMMEEPK
jgi:hypothetical protein